ncbi:MAG TPA: hypothetical protein VGL29_20895, partial [Blastocatellia bacterium]
PAWRAAASDCAKTSTGMIPLTDLGSGFYQGKQGGLYPGGSNACPAAHAQAGLQIADSIVPRKFSGKPKAKGSIVLLSVGMSNTTQEFSSFKPLADVDPNKNPKLVIVDGAQGGMAANIITNPNDPKYQQFWQTVDDRLAQANVTPKQVQIAWVKQADIAPTAHFPNDALALQQELEEIAHILVERFPNIKIAYYSSRIYAGYASTQLNPEPFAYQSGFAVKWMIEKQINGSPDLNYDQSLGEVKAPWLAWGPYLWADGLTPRSDGLTWACSQYVDDGTHPAAGAGGAREKVAHMLLDFFKSDSTSTPWFLARK